MSKLLSDEELATQLIIMAKRIGTSLDDAIDAKLEQSILNLIKTQKRLYAESVIGDDEAAAECSYLPPTLREMAGLSKDVRNQLRAEQRKKING